MMHALLRQGFLACCVLLLPAARAAAGVLNAHSSAAPVSRVGFQAILSGQLQQYMSLPPAAGLERLRALSTLPTGSFQALAADRAAASAALALIASPEAPRLRDDREARVVLSRALGRENVALIVVAAAALRENAAADPALSAALARVRSGSAPEEGDIERVRADLKRFFDGSALIKGLPEPAAAANIDNSARRVLLKAPAERLSADAADLAQETGGFLYKTTDETGRMRRYKVYPQDALTFERRAIPAGLAGVYEELPEGALRQATPDPMIAALNDAKIELWGVRHGETETSRARLLSGSGVDPALTKTPNAQGVYGEEQARVAALRMYDNLGGDGWARGVLAGIDAPLVILKSPLQRARQTAAAFERLLDQKARGLAGGEPRRLYEAHVERGLSEIAFGDFEAMPLEKAGALASWPAYISESGRTYLDRFPNGESRFDVMIRQRGVLRRVVRDYPGRRVVAFSHRETIVAQKGVLGLTELDPVDGGMRATRIENAEPVRLTFPGASLVPSR